VTAIKIRSNRRLWLGVWAWLVLAASARAACPDPRLSFGERADLLVFLGAREAQESLRGWQP
jgi:hypothetical protein